MTIDWSVREIAILVIPLLNVHCYFIHKKLNFNYIL